LQDSHLFGYIATKSVARSRKRNPESGKRQRVAATYIIDDGLSKTEVCITAFCSVYGVTKNRIERLRNHKPHAYAPTDQRGLHNNRSNCLSQSTLRTIDEFIASLPCCVSHYSLQDNSKKKYFTQDILSVS